MKVDIHGQIVLSEQDLFELYMKDPDRTIIQCFGDLAIPFDPELELPVTPKIIPWTEDSSTQEEFDNELQNNWSMPSEYQNLDIAAWVLGECQTEQEIQRVGQELIMYQDRELFPLLRYLKYLVDTLREHSIVWGVGRGSSVASYVLYLIGVHRINSIYYDLSIEEFLR